MIALRIVLMFHYYSYCHFRCTSLHMSENMQYLVPCIFWILILYMIIICQRSPPILCVVSWFL
jgi:hypothetical protein